MSHQLPPEMDPNSHINRAPLLNSGNPPTVRVIHKESGTEMVINRTDFDPEIHEEFGAKKPKPEKKSKKDDEDSGEGEGETKRRQTLDDESKPKPEKKSKGE